jgi:hypothetical protein
MFIIRTVVGSELSRDSPPTWASARLFLQYLEEKDDHQPCEGGELRLRGPGQTASTAFRRAPSSMAWMVLSLPS